MDERTPWTGRLTGPREAPRAWMRTAAGPRRCLENYEPPKPAPGQQCAHVFVPVLMCYVLRFGRCMRYRLMRQRELLANV